MEAVKRLLWLSKMPTALIVILFLICIIWLSGVSYFLWKLVNHYNSLTRGVHNKNLATLLEQVFQDNSSIKKDIEMLVKRCATMEHESLSHVQKIGLLRFNPFKDTGGDQSFILALIDGKETGIVISGLYSRSGTRWYAKKLENGKAVDHELSDEEKKAIALARDSH